MKKIYAFILVFMISYLSSEAQNLSTPLDSAILACFPFNGNANDVSGNNNNGVVNGAVLTNDRFANPNSAYSFNGTNQNISILNFSNEITTNEQSISFWATATGYYTRSAFLMVPDVTTNRYNIHIYYGNQFSNSQTFWDYGDIFNNGRLYTNPSPIPNSGQWDHWVFVTSTANSFQKCYKNGVLIFSKPTSSTFSNAQLKNLLIGGGVGSGGALFWFAGSIDDVKIYERVLLQNDVTQLYNNNFSCSSCVSPTIDVGSNVTLCAGSSTILTASGALTYSWSTGANTNSVNVSPSVTTVYSVTGNNGACVGSKTIMVTVQPTPTVNATATETFICANHQVTLNASGANTYTWVPSFSNSVTLIDAPSVTTVYTLTGADINGCIDTQAIMITVAVCSGVINNGYEEVSFSVYPNPATNNLMIYYPCSSTNEMLLEVLDITGKSMKLKSNTFSKNSAYCDLDIHELAKGIYFFKLTVKNGDTKTIRLIKE